MNIGMFKGAGGNGGIDFKACGAGLFDIFKADRRVRQNQIKGRREVF
jgi:hypothetical protein